MGEDRRVAAERFATETVAAHQLNGRYILQNMPRYLIHSNGTVLYNDAPATWDDETPTDFDGFIPRHSSTNNMLPVKAENGWLSERGQVLKGVIFPYQENATKVVDLSKLYNREGTGIMQRILSIEDEIIERGSSLIVDARQSGALSEASLADLIFFISNFQI